MFDSEEDSEIIDIVIGNPLTPQIYKASRGFINEFYELHRIIREANKLASTCDCEICKKIKEITYQPIFG